MQSSHSAGEELFSFYSISNASFPALAGGYCKASALPVPRHLRVPRATLKVQTGWLNTPDRTVLWIPARLARETTMKR